MGIAENMEQAGNFLPFSISCDVEVCRRWYGLEYPCPFEKPQSLDNLSEEGIKWVQYHLFEMEYILPIYKDENGNTALHYACDEGNLKIVEILLDADCDTNIKNINKQTPLYLSAKRGYFDISKKLIESSAEINLEDSEKNSPLHYICKTNYVELLKYFLTKNPKKTMIIGKKSPYSTRIRLAGTISPMTTEAAKSNVSTMTGARIAKKV